MRLSIRSVTFSVPTTTGLSLTINYMNMLTEMMLSFVLEHESESFASCEAPTLHIRFPQACPSISSLFEEEAFNRKFSLEKLRMLPLNIPNSLRAPQKYIRSLYSEVTVLH